MVQMENDVYTQIGLVMFIAWAQVHPIVAFAKRGLRPRYVLVDAALSAAGSFRPLMMTALAFIVPRVRAAMR